MSNLEEIEARLAAVEERLGMESGFRAAMDADLRVIKVTLRAHTQMHEQTQQLIGAVVDGMERLTRIVEGVVQAVDAHTNRFNEIDNRFDEVDNRFDEVDNRFNKVDNRFNEVDNRLDRMDGKLDTIISHLRPGENGTA